MPSREANLPSAKKWQGKKKKKENGKKKKTLSKPQISET